MEPDIIPLKQALAAAEVIMHEPPGKSADCLPPAKSAMKQTIPTVSRKSKRHSYPRRGSQGFAVSISLKIVDNAFKFPIRLELKALNETKADHEQVRPTASPGFIRNAVSSIKTKSKKTVEGVRRVPTHLKKLTKVPRILMKKLSKAKRTAEADSRDALNEAFANDEDVFDEVVIN